MKREFLNDVGLPYLEFIWVRWKQTGLSWFFLITPNIGQGRDTMLLDKMVYFLILVYRGLGFHHVRWSCTEFNLRLFSQSPDGFILWSIGNACIMESIWLIFNLSSPGAVKCLTDFVDVMSHYLLKLIGVSFGSQRKQMMLTMHWVPRACIHRK